MKIIVNGEHSNYSDSLIVGELLVQQKVKMPEMASVELNDRILRRTEFKSTALEDNDKI